MVRSVTLIAAFSFAAYFGAAVPTAHAATRDEIDAMTTYAVVIGRSIACGADSSNAMRRVGAWLDRTFTPGTKQHSTNVLIFVEGVKLHADLQRRGKSPDPCSAVLRTFDGFPWP
jgi:hypothetical protein